MKVHGSIRVPGDKSISHRALLLAALADGPSRICNVLPSADVHSTAGVLRTLGVDVPELAPDIEVTGRGLRSLREPRADLDCGNSGTTTRLMAGIAAACPFASRFTGDASLSRRPMQRVARPLTTMGATFAFEQGDGLPMRVRGGALHALDWATETASAQTKSAILLAGLVAGVPVRVREPARSRDHTERMLAARGVRVTTEGTRVELEPAERLEPVDMTVPSDPSSAAFLTALALLADDGALELPMVCLNETRTGFFRAVARMGARVELAAGLPQGGETAGTVHVRPSELMGIDLAPSEVPSMIDELPLLACLGARSQGVTTITGAAELRVKESDRIATTVSNLRAIGVEAEERPDGMRIVGGSHVLRGTIHTHGDHRIAMAFGVLAALPGNQIAIDDPGCVAVSYPAFWDDLHRATAE